MRVLVVRNDRIGDLILATPVISTLRANYQDAYIGILVSKYAEDVVKNNPEINKVITDEFISDKKSIKNFLKLFRIIRTENFDTAIILFPSFLICLLIFLTGIKRRISHGSKWYVYLFCNEILLQHRSRVEKHEAEYNLALAKRVGNINILIKETKIFLNSKSTNKVKNQLIEKGVHSNFIIMHCGSGGSARNWSVSSYARLADMITERLKIRTIFTGRENDYKMIKEIENQMRNKPEKILNTKKISELCALISIASLFIGPSTGPLHIASALKVPLVGIYSPVRVQSKKRWGPYNAEKAVIFSPDVACPARFRCIYDKCKYYDCMDLIKVEDVFNVVAKLIQVTSYD